MKSASMMRGLVEALDTLTSVRCLGDVHVAAGVLARAPLHPASVAADPDLVASMLEHIVAAHSAHRPARGETATALESTHQSVLV